MSTFTLAISCLTTPTLPWFMELTVQVPMQYSSVQNQTLFPSPVTSTTGCSFCFGSVNSFSLELFLHWSPVAYWASTDLGSSSFSVLSFCLSYCLWGSQGKNTEGVCHSLLKSEPRYRVPEALWTEVRDTVQETVIKTIPKKKKCKKAKWLSEEALQIA